MEPSVWFVSTPLLDMCMLYRERSLWRECIKDLMQLISQCPPPAQDGKRACGWETCSCVKWWVGQKPKYHSPMTDKCKLCAWLAEECMNGAGSLKCLCCIVLGKCVHVYMIHCLQRVPSHNRGNAHVALLSSLGYNNESNCVFALVHIIMPLLLPLFPRSFSALETSAALHAKLPLKPWAKTPCCI